jgi:hypothetical protein
MTSSMRTGDLFRRTAHRAPPQAPALMLDGYLEDEEIFDWWGQETNQELAG